VAAHWTKRERDGAPDDARKSAKSPTRPDILTSLDEQQRTVLAQLVKCVDADSSVVITNPLLKDNPIVYVTEPWQCMCGYSEAEALGKNPRITQGGRTDPNVVRLLSSALSKQSACKVQFVNYRGGHLDKPFWNMLSISPVHYQGNVLFYMANLQDYSYHVSKMVALTAGQFCRAAAHHQRGRRLQPMDALMRAKPAIIEADETFALPTPTSSEVLGSKFVLNTPQPIKRLGWNNLTLEPEHLAERLKDALQSMGATYEIHERGDRDGEIFILHAKLDNVACRITVSEDPDNGSQRISVTRLAGDTFIYHDAFRQLRQHLGDACTHVLHGTEASASAALALKRSIGLKLAPEPPAIVEMTAGAAAS